MNQFFFETRGKEKVRNLMDEGIRSQAYRRSVARGFNLPKFIVTALGILGIVVMFGRCEDVSKSLADGKSARLFLTIYPPLFK
jgi:hypothetical protein